MSGRRLLFSFALLLLLGLVYCSKVHVSVDVNNHHRNAITHKKHEIPNNDVAVVPHPAATAQSAAEIDEAQFDEAINQPIPFTPLAIEKIISRVKSAPYSDMLQVLKDNITGTNKVFIKTEDCTKIINLFITSSTQMDVAVLLWQYYTGGSLGDYKEALSKSFYSMQLRDFSTKVAALSPKPYQPSSTRTAFTADEVSKIKSRVSSALSTDSLQVLQDNMVGVNKIFTSVEDCTKIVSSLGYSNQVDGALLLWQNSDISVGDYKDAVAKTLSYSQNRELSTKLASLPARSNAPRSKTVPFTATEVSKIISRVSNADYSDKFQVLKDNILGLNKVFNNAEDCAKILSPFISNQADAALVLWQYYVDGSLGDFKEAVQKTMGYSQFREFSTKVASITRPTINTNDNDSNNNKDSSRSPNFIGKSILTSDEIEQLSYRLKFTILADMLDVLKAQMIKMNKAIQSANIAAKLIELFSLNQLDAALFLSDYYSGSTEEYVAALQQSMIPNVFKQLSTKLGVSIGTNNAPAKPVLFTATEVSKIISRVSNAGYSDKFQVLKDNILGLNKVFNNAEDCAKILSSFVSSQADAAILLWQYYVDGSVGDFKDAVQKTLGYSDFRDFSTKIAALTKKP